MSDFVTAEMNRRKQRLVEVATEMLVSQGLAKRGDEKGIRSLQSRLEESFHKARIHGILVEKLYWIGSIRLPQTVVTALNAKIEATQMAQQRENEVAQAKAEADKKVAEARGEAESLRLKPMSITQSNLELERLQIQKTLAEKWDGHLPTTMVPGQTVPFLNVK